LKFIKELLNKENIKFKIEQNGVFEKMASKNKFIPGLKLSRMLFEEEISSIMEDKFPNLQYAATSLGPCSEILGLDDKISMDHQWGPKIGIVISDTNYAKYSNEIMKTFKEILPPNFKGLNMMWAKPGIDIHNTNEKALYNIYITTLPGILNFHGKIKRIPFEDTKWLGVSEQHLLEFTSGEVYIDNIGELTKAREFLSYYPDNVLKYLLMMDWSAIGGDWFPMGRMVMKGDDLGLRIQTAKIVQHMMRIAFRLSKKYYPYRKWFGTIFKSLPIASKLEPLLLDLTQEGDWKKIEEKICIIDGILLNEQNKMSIMPKINIIPEMESNKRHYMKFDYLKIRNKIFEDLKPPLNLIDKNAEGQWDARNRILWENEVGKWPFVFLQKV